METLIDLIKNGGGVDRLGLALALLGWIAREIVGLRRSRDKFGGRIGRLEKSNAEVRIKLALPELALSPTSLPDVDPGRGDDR